MPSTKIRLELDLRREKSDKTYPVVIRITHNRIQSRIGTGYHVNKSNWEEKSLTINKNSHYGLRTGYANLSIKQQESDYQKKIFDLEEEGILETMSLKELIKRLKDDKLSKQTFIEYTEELAKQLKSKGKIGTSNTYLNTVSFFKRHNNDQDLEFNDITPDLLKSFEETYMSDPERHYNGLSVYMRTIRAIYNKAISDHIADIRNYPFKQNPSDKNKYRIKEEKTCKRAIPKSFIEQIENYIPPKGARKNKINARLFFLFSFYIRGINFIDMAHLKKKNINENKIVYRRTKTGRKFEIKINEKAKAILNHFNYTKLKPNQYIFPIIHRPFNKELMYMDIRNGTKNTNVNLQKIAKELGINSHLTTYVSRHSWATIADTAGVDRKIISKGLGHADLHTTEIYIDDLVSNTDLEDADDIITG